MSKLVLFQGDSITDANRNREMERYMGHGYALMAAGVLGAEYPGEYTFLNRGVSGNRSVDLYARIKQDIINLKPDYLSILIGVNDVWHEYTRKNGVSADKYELICSLLIEEIKQALPDIKIMILEPFVLQGSKTSTTDEFPGRWEHFSTEVPLRAQAAKRIAEKYGLVFVPLQETFNHAQELECAEEYWLADGVHPTAAGHELIKRAWLKGFEKLCE